MEGPSDRRTDRGAASPRCTYQAITKEGIVKSSASPLSPTRSSTVSCTMRTASSSAASPCAKSGAPGARSLPHTPNSAHARHPRRVMQPRTTEPARATLIPNTTEKEVMTGEDG
jgi:hypothetical protein